MSPRRRRGRQPAAVEAALSIARAERLDAEREKVFNAMAIVNVARAACDSTDVQRDLDIMTYALKAAYDLLDEVAGALQVLRDEDGGAGGAAPRVGQARSAST